MNTPICDFVAEYSESDPIRLHMPGHKGKAILGSEALDITEIDGADVLYHGDGIIRKSEENASSLFGTAKTVYSCEGSSLCIRAMVYLAKQLALMKKSKPLILAGRNAHKTFVTACALMDVKVEWLHPENPGIISCDISNEQICAKIKELRPTAIYITSPDYIGNIACIKDIAGICRLSGIPLMVDNAHGAYLKFLPESSHPMDLGADICCDSAHKTLPALTGGAYLHISKNAPDIFLKNAESAMSLFASTSPSYLILQSLDKINALLADNLPSRLKNVLDRVSCLKNKLKSRGFLLLGTEPLKLTISAKEYGYYGHEMAALLYEKNIICEFSDPDFVVMMFSSCTDIGQIDKLERVLLSLPKKVPIEERAPLLPRPNLAVSPHEALMMPCEEADIQKSFGKVLAAPCVSCPPAIPIASLGEVIDDKVIACFKYYHIEKCLILKER